MTITKVKDVVFGSIYAFYGIATFGVGEVYATGGQTLNLAGLAKATRKPLLVSCMDLSGYGYQYTPGTNANNGTIKIYVQGSGAGNPAAELGAGAVPAGVSSDTIYFVAQFNGML